LFINNPEKDTLFFSWGKRNLTILGKMMIIKALVIPIFTFVASGCVVPDKYRKEIESKCFKFTCDGKPDKVKRNTMIRVINPEIAKNKCKYQTLTTGQMTSFWRLIVH
jgi:hypothetical protein